MAKKKKTMAEGRWGDLAIKDLRAAVKDLRAITETLDRAAIQAETWQLTTVRVDGITKLERGLNELKLFKGHALKGVEDACSGAPPENLPD